MNTHIQLGSFSHTNIHIHIHAHTHTYAQTHTFNLATSTLSKSVSLMPMLEPRATSVAFVTSFESLGNLMGERAHVCVCVCVCVSVCLCVSVFVSFLTLLETFFIFCGLL